MKDIDYANMSDEDFEKLSIPEDASTGSFTTEVDEPEPEEVDFESPDGTLEGALNAAAEATTDEENDPDGDTDLESENSKDNQESEEDDQSSETEQGSDKSSESNGNDDGTKGSVDHQSTPDSGTGSETLKNSEPDHTTPKPIEAQPSPEEPQQLSVEDAYSKIMAPFKANGRDFTPRDPDEVIRLMQQGVSYAKKMESLKPNLRIMRMLEQKGLLDESKLNYLIDLNDGNPAAIHKLLHGSKIDPLTIDTNEEPSYQPNNHSVSDAEFAFTETLRDLQTSEDGEATLTAINQQWDQASKEELYKEPGIIKTIHEQRVNGVYDRITDELSRQKVLGNFVDVPFIHAYKAVGDYLHSRNELYSAPNPEPTGGNAQGETLQPRELVETRTAPSKAPLANGDRVSGTAPPRSTPQAAARKFDVFAMSDDEIMAVTLPNS